MKGKVKVVQKRSTTKATTKAGSNNNGKKLTAKDLEHFKTMLLTKRREIFGDVSEMHNEALRSSRSEAAGDLSSMPIHMADMGTDTYEQELALSLMDGERKLIIKIDEALERITQGTYGVCQGTGKQINKKRLEAKPWARYSLKYAEMIEKGMAPGEPQ